MVWYDIFNKIFGRGFKDIHQNYKDMKNEDNLNKHLTIKAITSKLETKSLSDNDIIRGFPGLGRGWTVKDLNAYCKRPGVIEGVKNLDKYNFLVKK